MGKWVFDKGHSDGMTPEARQAIESLGILFKGPMETPKGKGVKSVNVTARKTWNTYANKRVFQTLHGVDTVFSKAGIPIDITVVRENIEDTYGGIEHMLTHDVTLSRRFITRPGSLQVIKYAFEMAKKKNARQSHRRLHTALRRTGHRGRRDPRSLNPAQRAGRSPSPSATMNRQLVAAMRQPSAVRRSSSR
jgi:isocitrate/isopropylmalate dehydrogenase